MIKILKYETYNTFLYKTFILIFYSNRPLLFKNFNDDIILTYNLEVET